MESLWQFWENQWHAYPQWLVLTSVCIAALLVLWVAAKFAAWLLKWLLIAAVLAVIVIGILFLIG
jgi:hypothetical protein